MKPLIPILLSALLCVPTLSAQQTRLLTADNYNDYGLVYTLPSTALQIKITARQTMETAGPFAQYAAKSLGRTDVVTENNEFWEITGISVTPYGVSLQGAEQYRMQLKPGALTYIAVDDNGMISSINTTPEPQNLHTDNQDESLSPLRPESPDDYLMYVNEDFIAAQSQLKKAQLLTEGLLETRSAKNDLATGNADTQPTDGTQLRLMIEELQKRENALTKAFTGTRRSIELSKTFTFIPDEDGEYVLCRLSDFSGFTDPEDLSGDPVYISVEQTRAGEIPVDEKGNPKIMPKDGVAYCIPGAANITIRFNGRRIYSGETECAQYGSVFALSPSLFTAKKDPAYAIFNPVTGGLRAIGSVKDLDK